MAGTLIKEATTMNIKLIAGLALFSVTGCSELYVPHNGEVPHGYMERYLPDGRLEVSYETWREMPEEGLCGLAERRLEELGGTEAGDIARRVVQQRQQGTRVPLNQGLVTRAESQWQRYSVWQTVDPAYETFHTIQRCTLVIEGVSG